MAAQSVRRHGGIRCHGGRDHRMDGDKRVRTPGRFLDRGILARMFWHRGVELPRSKAADETVSKYARPMTENHASLPRLTFIVPVRNESARIDRCLSSIRAQDYPQGLIEILVPDQSSTDDTKERARRYGARVTDNPAWRAIFSMPRAFAEATGDLAVIMAADNCVAPEFARRMAAPFAFPEVSFAFPQVTTDRPDYCLTTRYFNRFTDPMNHFIYGNACCYRELRRAYEPIRSEAGFDLYRFPPHRPPLVAIAQGAVVRLPYRMPEQAVDDVGCVFQMIEAGAVMACVTSPLVDHYTATSLGDVLRKFRPRIAERMKPGSALLAKDVFLPPDRMKRRFLWPFYACSIVGPVLIGLWRAAMDREPLWLFHPVISFAFGWTVALEALKNLRVATRFMLAHFRHG
jgi:glycosyltransferase involved in cell wall biosynthesis